MDALRIEKMSLRPQSAEAAERQHAVDVAGQFEAVFVRTIVQSLRQTASVGGDNMFGSGPGADTYADWFDQNFADEIGRSSDIGIATSLIRDMERHGQVERDNAPRADDALAAQQQRLLRAADPNRLTLTKAGGQGAIDVVL